MAHRDQFQEKKAEYERRKALEHAEQAFEQAAEEGLHVDGFHETTRTYLDLK